MTADRWGGVPDLLSSLEDLELPLLSWGVVDGHLSAADVTRAIDAQLDRDVARDPGSAPPTEEEYLSHLLEKGLLHRVPDTEGRYRTRLAETLRLLRNLRQLLPGRENQEGWWRRANSLVADYRLRISPRWYPDRVATVEDLLGELAELGNWSSARSEVVRRVVGDRKLARFQGHATRSILAALAEPGPAARIVTAGTGSGKTLAFYLPALVDLAGSLGVPRTGPHTLALYPRNELLRDQARETLRVVQRVGPLGGPEARTARIGVLYGSTPKDAKLTGKAMEKWQRVPNGWATPYFPCLDDQCGGRLVWLDSDRTAGVERLRCATCGATTAPDAIALTRSAIRANPPDILFSSTEMLSKQSTSWQLASVLGWKGPNGTRLVLLDEVHTYAGLHGAQVALMLRRWRNANRNLHAAAPVMVGLSATLRDAGDFFAALTGVDRANVEVIAPATSELQPTSRDYAIVLRGDPLSGTSLLSTTIQTAMLVERSLDPTPGIYGSVTFAFTDDLDVINRLYDDLRDAEGHNPRGMARGRVLATLRSPGSPFAAQRYRDGQSWDLPDRLGRMDGALRIARTSSQDAGVDNAADVVVATSSLEVGFNDPRVGAIIQHKAPRDMASFLQRRGRAGRSLAMRPVTTVVLSDYGRDRIAYQSYERLLDPEIPARTLPVGNRFVVKIQATHALLDWIHRRTGIDARWVLSPTTGKLHDRTAEVAQLLGDLLDEAEVQRLLADHLKWALGITADEVAAAMWEEPRSLLLSVVPTALRRLESEWRTLPGQADPATQESDPLPEFMTSTLFDALNTPDVRLLLPFNTRDVPTMEIAQAMREAVPGRVSRRFGYVDAEHRTWLPVPAPGTDLPLAEVVAAGHGLGVWATPSGEEFTVVRPLTLKLHSPPRQVETSSSAMPVWRSVFDYPEQALHEVPVPTPSFWADLVERCGFALHVTGGPLRVRRMAIGSEGELAESGGGRITRRPISIRYVHADRPAALGFELEVDAMVLTGRLPDADTPFLREFAAGPAWRTLSFKQRVREDHRLDNLANNFQREWLCEVYRHAYVTEGLKGGDRAGANAALAHGAWARELDEFLAAAYRADQAHVADSRLLDTLRSLSTDAVVRAVMEEHGQLLAEVDPGELTGDLLDRTLLDTLGCAVLTAVHECVADAQDSDLVMDVELDPEHRTFRVLVSETSIGGLGILEALHRDYVLDPRRFWDAVGRACSSTEAEDVDRSMLRLVDDLVGPDSAFAPAIAAFRGAVGISAMDIALQELIRCWTAHDGPPSHLLLSTVAARLLRPGSKPVIDRVLADLTAAWVGEEERLGVEIDSRTITFLAERDLLGFALTPLTPDMAYSLLWLRGPQARTQRLEHWHPFRKHVMVERLILDGILTRGLIDVDVTVPDWCSSYVAALEAGGRVILSAPNSRRAEFAVAMRTVAATPVEHAGLRVYGRLDSVAHHDGRMRAGISLAEELQ